VPLELSMRQRVLLTQNFVGVEACQSGTEATSLPDSRYCIFPGKVFDGALMIRIFDRRS